MFSPRILFTGSTSNIMDLGAKFGVEFFEPEIFICENWNPAPCSIVTTTDNISSADCLSIPVTSTRMLLVFVVTVVNAALMIGGNDIVSPFASIIIGTLED